jgi:small-conductance mechanosensitive channel
MIIAPEKWQSLIISLLLIAVAVIAGFIIHAILIKILSKWKKRSEAGAGGLKINIDYLKAPLRALLPALCLVFISPALQFSDPVMDFINRVLSIWIILTMAWLVIRMIALLKDRLQSRYQIDVKDNLKARQIHTQLRVAQRVLNAIIIILALATILMTFDKVRQLGVSILASAGIIGVIVGFAAQKSITTIFAGIQIAITQPIRIEDVVIVENEWGWIEEITLTYVVVRIWDQRRLVVPITYFIEKPFQNWTRSSAWMLGTVYIYTDYTVPVEKIREKLYEILEASEYWDHKVKVLQVTSTTERTMELRALMSAPDSPTAWNLRCQVRESLLAFLQSNYPSGLPRVRLETEIQKESSQSQS